MKKYQYLGLGSNLGHRRQNLKNAIQALEKIGQIRRVSPIYETPALLPNEAPEDWNQPYLNMVLEIQTEEPPLDFLKRTKLIESQLERQKGPRWSPRSIDIDILLWGDEEFQSEELTLPHPDIEKRSFVLDPLKDLLPDYIHPSRNHKSHAPLWMGIFNLTPDSFSDGGELNPSLFSQKVDSYEKLGVHILDLGAESTRPQASSISASEEWSRLQPYLQILKEKYPKKSKVKPLISLDTRNVATAEKALEYGVDIINNVAHPTREMFSFLQNAEVQYVLTHSLDVPVDPSNCISQINDIHIWLEEKVELFLKMNIDPGRIYFDPGIGFGKNSLQSLEVLKKLQDFHKYPFKLLIGHSRKSFMKNWASPSRELETLGASLALVQKGVDVLRVHHPEIHIAAFKGWSHVIG